VEDGQRRAIKLWTEQRELPSLEERSDRSLLEVKAPIVVGKKRKE
jgi:hypothetical protein